MKFIITESKYKNIIFRYFDKFGGDINRQFILNFGLDNENNDITYEQAYKYLIEWRGIEESKNLANTILLQHPHHIDDFGGYEFVIKDYKAGANKIKVIMKTSKFMGSLDSVNFSIEGNFIVEK